MTNFDGLKQALGMSLIGNVTLTYEELRNVWEMGEITYSEYKLLEALRVAINNVI